MGRLDVFVSAVVKENPLLVIPAHLFVDLKSRLLFVGEETADGYWQYEVVCVTKVEPKTDETAPPGYRYACRIAGKKRLGAKLISLPGKPAVEKLLATVGPVQSPLEGLSRWSSSTVYAGAHRETNADRYRKKFFCDSSMLREFLCRSLRAIESNPLALVPRKPADTAADAEESATALPSDAKALIRWDTSRRKAKWGDVPSQSPLAQRWDHMMAVRQLQYRQYNLASALASAAEADLSSSVTKTPGTPSLGEPACEEEMRNDVVKDMSSFSYGAIMEVPLDSAATLFPPTPSKPMGVLLNIVKEPTVDMTNMPRARNRSNWRHAMKQTKQEHRAEEEEVGEDEAVWPGYVETPSKDEAASSQRDSEGKVLKLPPISPRREMNLNPSSWYGAAIPADFFVVPKLNAPRDSGPRAAKPVRLRRHEKEEIVIKEPQQMKHRSAAAAAPREQLSGVAGYERPLEAADKRAHNPPMPSQCEAADQVNRLADGTEEPPRAAGNPAKPSPRAGDALRSVGMEDDLSYFFHCVPISEVGSFA